MLLNHIWYFQRVEAQDGGDANIEVSPRDIVYTEPAEPLNAEKPQVLLKLDLRYRYWTTAGTTLSSHNVTMGH